MTSCPRLFLVVVVALQLLNLVNCRSVDTPQHGSISSTLDASDVHDTPVKIVKVREGQDPNPRADFALGPWECSDDSEKCLLYKQQFNTEMQFLMRHSHALLYGNFVQRGLEIEAVIDSILLDYRQGRKTLSEAIAALEDPSFFKGSGYVVGFYPSAYELVGIASEENWRDWAEQIFGGSVAGPPHGFGGMFTRPGTIKVKQPVLNNGFAVEDQVNYPVMLGYLLILAEEFYHATQYMQGKNKSLFEFTPDMLISKYFTNLNLDELPNDHIAHTSPGEMLEVDVYAKMLEVLGKSLVPDRIREVYSARALVDLDKIVLDSDR